MATTRGRRPTIELSIDFNDQGIVTNPYPSPAPEVVGHLQPGAYGTLIPSNSNMQYFTPPTSAPVSAPPLPTLMIPYDFVGAPIPPVPQQYPDWTVDAEGRKKTCYQLLMDRLERGHADTLSEEFHAFAQGKDGRTEIMLAERGTTRNYPYANIKRDSAVQESDFSVGSNI